MQYLKKLKNAAIFGGLLLGIAFLNKLTVDAAAAAGALAVFSILAINDVGRRYIEFTRQSAVVKHLFGVIVNPLLPVIFFPAFFYAAVGEVVWYFWLLGFFIGLILLIVEAFDLADALKKS